MSHLKISILFTFLFVVSGQKGFTQEPENEKVSNSEISLIVHRIADSLAYYYVNQEEGLAIGNHLIDALNNNAYRHLTQPSELANKLTKDLRSVNGDLHLFVKYHGPSHRPVAEEKTEPKDEKGLPSNYGFSEIRFYPDNIAYLRIEHFSNWDYASKARQKIAELMGLFKNNDALIIDVRDNRGGVPYIASFLASYFFTDTPVHLADFYTRYNNYKYGIYTEPFVPGVKLPDTPVFILVNERSASAAEELAFWLQNHNRAVVIGQPTAGAGYGALNHTLNERFSISISSEEEINPITKQGFQGTGIIPDSIVESEKSLEVALELAKQQIAGADGTDSLLLKELYQLLESQPEIVNASELFEQIINLNQIGRLSYDDIYNLGTQYIDDPQKSIPIFRANTVLYSYYPHPFEDYAKALVKGGDFKGALKNFNKAIELATLKNNPSLNQFELSKKEFLQEYSDKMNQ